MPDNHILKPAVLYITSKACNNKALGTLVILVYLGINTNMKTVININFIAKP